VRTQSPGGSAARPETRTMGSVERSLFWGSLQDFVVKLCLQISAALALLGRACQLAECRCTEGFWDEHTSLWRLSPEAAVSNIEHRPHNFVVFVESL